jgi:N-acyl-D-amino-acid deacylase
MCVSETISKIGENMKIIIRNGNIVDGTRRKAFQGDILIIDNKIEAVESSIPNIPGAFEIDATGLVVSPGFIDTHSHSDLQVLIEPEVLPKMMQGITTEVLGQDGISMAPLPISYIDAWRKNLAGLDGDTNAINWEYQTTEEYLNMIQNVGPGINELYLVPHGNIRMEACGLDNKEATPEELDKMKAILKRELEAGAYGLSTGLIYMPCAYSNTKEIIELCKVVAAYEGVFVVHQRSEADTILDSMEEIIKIGKESGVRIHFSHFKVCGKNNWGKIEEVLSLMEKAKQEGIRISFDQYPYVAGSTMLGVVLPPWVHSGGTQKVLERLADKELRKQMIIDIEKGIEGWDNFIAFAGFEQIFITSTKTEKNVPMIGLSLLELAKRTGKDKYEALFDLLLEEENAVGMVDFYGKEEHIKTFMKLEEMNVCTDGLLGGKPHPRVYGAFPRVLSKYVKEEKLLSLEQAIYKMTGKAARAMQIKQRGNIKPGYYADLCIFDLHKIKDKGTYTDPAHFPEGIDKVIVNGVIQVDHGEYIGERNGKVLRKNEN